MDGLMLGGNRHLEEDAPRRAFGSAVISVRYSCGQCCGAPYTLQTTRGEQAPSPTPTPNGSQLFLYNHLEPHKVGS